MSETNSQSPNIKKPAKLTNRGKVVVASGLMAVGATLGIAGNNVIQGALDQREYTSEQPGCEINVQQDDTITKINVRLREAGNKADPADIKVRANDGHFRTNAEGPSLGMRVGDSVIFSHVTPEACLAMEGLLIDNGDADQITPSDYRPVVDAGGMPVPGK